MQTNFIRYKPILFNNLLFKPIMLQIWVFFLAILTIYRTAEMLRYSRSKIKRTLKQVKPGEYFMHSPVLGVCRASACVQRAESISQSYKNTWEVHIPTFPNFQKNGWKARNGAWRNHPSFCQFIKWQKSWTAKVSKNHFGWISSFQGIY